MADGLPSPSGMQVWRDRTLRAKHAGGEYLNVEFGWLPLVSDMRKFAYSVNNSAKILSDYRAGSGKITRVGYHYPSSNQFTSGNQTIFLYTPGNSGFSGAVSATYVASQETNTWFSGAFKYHLPVPDSTISKIQLYADYADKLLGVKPTPENIWNSSPWTWGLDWFANMGDILTNVSQLGQNGLALMYGYIMSETRTKHTWTSVAGDSRTTGSVTRDQVYKKRLPANPYGFGVTDAGLTLQQKAIVVALGLGLTGKSGGHGR